MGPTSQIVIDKITQASNDTAPATPINMTHNVSSADAVLVIFVAGISTTNPPANTVTINGNVLPAVNSVTDAGSNVFSLYYYTRPTVGSNAISLVLTQGPDAAKMWAISLLGVDKKTTTPRFFGASKSSTATTLQAFQSATANSMVLDMFFDDNAGATIRPLAPQVQFANTAIAQNQAVVGLSYGIFPAGVNSTAWTVSTTGTTITDIGIILEPANAPSIWYPVVAPRNDFDVVPAVGRNVGSATPDGDIGYKPAYFYQNSFLHTVGRIIQGTVSPPTLVAETELQTSQVVIDKITQQASASAASLTSDHLVSSQDAVMLIFASQMGVAQGLNSVTLNGVPLTALGNPSISTLTAGAYYVVNPNVGINVISTNVTLPTALELIVITLLGVDKKTVSPVSTANSALTGSPSSTIQVASSNSLIIDYVGSLGTSIAENASQTVYFDQPQAASEAAGSIKLSTAGVQTMSWTTLSTAWVQLAVALEPANAPSIWFPVVDVRNMSDVIAVNNLDDSVNPVGSFYASYGNYPAQYWQNSFLHTIGRLSQPPPPVIAQQPLELQLLGLG